MSRSCGLRPPGRQALPASLAVLLATLLALAAPVRGRGAEGDGASPPIEAAAAAAAAIDAEGRAARGAPDCREAARHAAACDAADASGESVQLLQTNVGAAGHAAHAGWTREWTPPLPGGKEEPPANLRPEPARPALSSVLASSSLPSSSSSSSSSFSLSSPSPAPSSPASSPSSTKDGPHAESTSSSSSSSSPSSSPSPSSSSSFFSSLPSFSLTSLLASEPPSQLAAGASLPKRARMPVLLATGGDDLGMLQVSQSTGAKSSAGTTSGSSNVTFIILPMLGFVFAVASIGLTIYFESGGGPEGGVSEKGASPQSPRGVANFRRPGVRRSPPAGGAAGGLLQAGGGPPTRYQRPPLNRPMLDGLPAEGYSPTGMASPNPLFNSPPPPDLDLPQQHEPAYGELKISVPLATGHIIGLNLSEEDLVILSFADPAAERFGFRVGDKILAVNGMNVTSEDDFLMHLKGARSRSATFNEPIIFTIFRSGGPAPQDPTDWLGTWEYKDTSSKSGRHFQYKIKRDQNQIVFEQNVLENVVSGVLMPGQGNTAEAQLHVRGGEPYGVVVFRMPERGVLYSKLKLEGADGFGTEIMAKKVEPSTRRKKGGCVC